MKKPLVLMILDGYGIRDAIEGNAIKAAKTPVLDALWKNNPHTLLGASGHAVGLPEGQMGNSEVGHTNIGAGRVVYQELTRLTKAIDDGTLFKNEVLLHTMQQAKENNKALHLLGLVSDGGVHSHITHLLALLEMAKQQELERVYLHCFTDGRDTAPESGVHFITTVQMKLDELQVGRIATISGRYYAMDRDNRWERVQQAYNAIVYGEGEQQVDPIKAMERSYANGKTDEFVVPTVCDQEGMIHAGDSVIFFNFRPDRARELTRTLVDPAFAGFAPVEKGLGLNFVCMTEYDATMPHVAVAYPPEILHNTFGQIIADNGLKQLRIAETEKYPHVTFFFNGGTETVYTGEDRALIPSPKVATYDLQPEMSAYIVTEELLNRLNTGKYDVVILNFANGDMVGHTGNFNATVTALEALDKCIGKIADKVKEQGGTLLVTADHGNADQMVAANGGPFTAHTTNPVPFIVVGLGNVQLMPPNDGKLSDIAPTMLRLLGIAQPVEMTGKSIIQ